MSENLIFKQIPKVMADLDAVGKNGDNKIQGFKFRKVDDVVNALHAHLTKHGVFIVPEVIESSRSEGQTKSGGVMFYVTMKVKYSFFAMDGSSISATMVGEAMDTGDKASNKAQSVAFKYACLQVFAIPTEDLKDPEEESHEVAAPIAKPSAISAVKSRAETLIEKFRPHGVSRPQILAKYKVAKAEMLTPAQLDELNEIGREIANGRKTAFEAFPVEDF